MRANWWSCVLGLLSMPAEVILTELKAVQEPSTIVQRQVNSSVQIRCATSLESPLSLTLLSTFNQAKTEQIVYLALDKRPIGNIEIAPRFKNRIDIQSEDRGYELTTGFILQLSLLGLNDTDLYYCQWSYIEMPSIQRLTTNGTVVIVRDIIPTKHFPSKKCENNTLDFFFISLSVTALIVLLFLCIAVIIFKIRKVRKCFKPALAERPSRLNRPLPNRPLPNCPQTSPNQCSYLVTNGCRADFQRHM